MQNLENLTPRNAADVSFETRDTLQRTRTEVGYRLDVCRAINGA